MKLTLSTNATVVVTKSLIVDDCVMNKEVVCRLVTVSLIVMNCVVNTEVVGKVVIVV